MRAEFTGLFASRSPSWVSCCFRVIPALGAATLYVSASGSDSGTCTQAAPCKSFARAYNVATAGSDVLVSAGTYPEQSLTGLAAKPTAEKVVFKPAAGAVTLDYLSVSGSQNIEVRDMSAPWQVRGNAKNIMLRNLTILDEQFGGYLGGVDGLQIIGGEIGRIDPQDGLHMNNADGPNSNVTIDGLYMHDLTRNTDSSVHTDCVQTGSASRTS